MARKKKSNPAAGALFGAIVFLLALAFIGQILRSLSGFALLALFLVVIGVVALAIFLKVVLPAQVQNNVLANVDALVDRHMEALIREHAMRVRSDPYGRPITDKWRGEVQYFIRSVVRPTFPASQQLILDREGVSLVRRVMSRVEAAAQHRPAFQAVSPEMTPAQFEAFCAEQLRMYGWEARLTPLCRDQGVDVIAAKGRYRVVLQCKLYTRPVGNKAVQEIVAGRAHQRAEYGAVVTNATYTAPAEELAATNGVLLLHHSDLPHLEQRLSGILVQQQLDWN